MRVGIISDSDAFIPLAYTLAQHQVQVHLFYCPSPDQATNQRSMGFLQQTGLPVTEEKITGTDLYNWLNKGQYDICFVLGYPRYIQFKQLNGLATPIYNIHFGPLPAFKGPSPVFWQLRLGMPTVGLAIHRMTARMDEGPLLWQKEVPNLPHYNYQSVNLLCRQLCVEGALHIIGLTANRMPIPVINTTAANTAYYKRPELNDVLINWQQMTAPTILHLIRACNPWNKGAITFYKQTELKLMDAWIVPDQQTTASPGTIVATAGGLQVSTAGGNVLNVNMLFWNDFFMPGYQSSQWGFAPGEVLG